MPDGNKLKILRQLREMHNLTQTDMATFFGLSGRSARSRISLWENGDEIPPIKHRTKFIFYLLNKLNLRNDIKAFEQIWSVLCKEWDWPPLTESEQKNFSPDPHIHIHQPTSLLPNTNMTSIFQTSTSQRLLKHNLPQRTYTQFVGRQIELHKLIHLMTQQSRHFLVTLDGIGGVGKSALALELAYHYIDNYNTIPIENRFEAIIWISAKQNLLTASGIYKRQQTFSNLLDLLITIDRVLELNSIPSSFSEAYYKEGRGLIDKALVKNRILLIVDNLETVDDEELLTFLRELPEPTKAIVTTRHRIDIAYPIRLAGMPIDDASALIDLEADRKNVKLSPEFAKELYRRTGGIPLAIIWSIGLISQGHSAEAILKRLGSGHSDIARFCFAECITRIQTRDSYRLLLALALFDSSVDRETLGYITGLQEDEIGRDDGLAELEQLSLINKEGDQFNLLPLTRVYVDDQLVIQHEIADELRIRKVSLDQIGNLSSRESGILELLAKGMTNRGIAETMRISTPTVQNHIQHIFRKLGVSNRTEAARWYFSYLYKRT